MVKRVFIVHGRGTSPEKGWYSWLRDELEAREIEAYVPKMPNSNFPKISNWVNFLRNNVGFASDDTYMVGHSLGAQAIIRYISELGEDEKVAGAILVAPFHRLKHRAVCKRVGEELNKFISSVPVSFPAVLENTLREYFVSQSFKVTQEWNSIAVNWDRARAKCGKYVCFFSTNDRYVDFREESAIFEKNLGSEVKVIFGGGHLGSGKKYRSFPQLLEEVLSMVRLF